MWLRFPSWHTWLTWRMWVSWGVICLDFSSSGMRILYAWKSRSARRPLVLVQGLSVTGGYALTCLALVSGILTHLVINNFLDRVFKSLSAHQWWMYRNGTKPFCSCDVSQLCVVWRLLGDSVSLPACCSFGAPLHVSSVICSPLWEVLGRKAEEQACTKWEGRRQKVIYMWKAFVPKRKNLPC